MKTHAEFFSADTFAEHITQGNIEHYQLESGSFQGELTQVISEKVMVGVHKMNLPVLQFGKGLKGVTSFLILGNMQHDVSWRKEQLTGTRIGVLKNDSPHFAITPPDFFGTPISISSNYFIELLTKGGYDKTIFSLIQQAEIIELDSKDAQRLQKMIVTLCNTDTVDIDLLKNRLPNLLVKSLEKAVKKAPKQQLNLRYAALGKILGYIHQNLNRKITTSEICSTFEISERSLRYLFVELIRIPPMRYVKLIRLNKIRKEILQADSESVINLIANKWGFNHSGQFAADYKKLFNEVPSEDLKKGIAPTNTIATHNKGSAN